MIVALLLAVLALVDGGLGGFRGAAGREGAIDKRAYFVAAVRRALAWSAVVVVANAALAAILVETSRDPAATWAALLAAGRTAIWVFGGFATLALAALGFWFSPDPDTRVLASIIVLGPLTLVRPFAIAGGLALAVARTPDLRVAIAAVAAGVSMLALEWLLGRRYATRWRGLVYDDSACR